MAKKIILIVSAVLTFGFGFAPRSDAGTEVIDGYSAPAPVYNYVPPPRPVYYAPPPPVNVLIFPAYGYVGPRYCGPRFVGHKLYGGRCRVAHLGQPAPRFR